MNINRPIIKKIRSFVRRQGRMTPSQQHAIDNYWQHYGLSLDEQLIDFDSVFGRKAKRIVEIGFGNGDSLFEMAKQSPDTDFIGIEVHKPGVGHLLNLLHTHQVNNVRIICDDAVDVLSLMIPDESLEAVYLFFPDPWPKKRHHKRRIVQENFVELVAQKLFFGGRFHMATDWVNYAEHMLQMMQQSENFNNLAGANHYCERPSYRPLTKFEQRGQRLGHEVRDLIFIRV